MAFVVNFPRPPFLPSFGACCSRGRYAQRGLLGQGQCNLIILPRLLDTSVVVAGVSSPLPTYRMDVDVPA